MEVVQSQRAEQQTEAHRADAPSQAPSQAVQA
jgi:hypothetical protein